MAVVVGPASGQSACMVVPSAKRTTWHVAGSPHASATICLPMMPAPPRASKPTSPNSACRFESAKFGELGESLGLHVKLGETLGLHVSGGVGTGGVGSGESQSIPQMHWERRHVPAGHNAFAPVTGGSTIGRGGGGGGAVDSIPGRFERWSDAERCLMQDLMQCSPPQSRWASPWGLPLEKVPQRRACRPGCGLLCG